MTEKTTKRIVMIGVAVIVLLFTLFGLVIKQDCDIDAIYLWCRLHPMGIADIIGLIGFYAGALFISGVLPFQFSNGENNTRWNWILFAVMALSLILIWNL